MKFKHLFKTIYLTLFVITLVACSDDDDTTFPADSESIADFVLDNQDQYSSLLAALEKANLVQTLSGTGNFTVFAPNNAAFNEFLGDRSLDDFSEEEIKTLLENHVLGIKVLSSEIQTGYVKNQADFSSYIAKEGDNVTINGVASVTTADVERSNGVIHAVDKVIDTPSLLTFAALDPSLSSLATTATTTTGFETDFGAVLGDKTGNALTLLAPTNMAFMNLGDISGLSAGELEQILLNHVISGSLLSEGLSTGYSSTLASVTFGDDTSNLSIYINTSDGVEFNGISKVSTADIVATNGVIHIVDEVITLPTVVTFATADPTFSTLETALTTLTPSTDFVATLSTTGAAPAPFTVFAPTDDAFGNITVPSDESDVADILNYHVVTGSNVRSSDLVDGPVATLNGNVTIDASAPSVKGAENDTASNIVATDVQAVNGVIHVIDQVLLPAAPVVF